MSYSKDINPRHLVSLLYGPSIKYVHSNLVFYRHPPHPQHIYAFKQWNNVIKTIYVCFSLDALPPPYSLHTLWISRYIGYLVLRYLMDCTENEHIEIAPFSS